MIEFHNSELMEDGFTPQSHWATVTDGEVTDTDPQNGPAQTTIETFIEKLNSELLSGIIDPIATVKHLSEGDVRACVPSKTDIDLRYSSSDCTRIARDGDLSQVEQHEISKYGTRKSEREELEDREPPIYKQYETDKSYQTLSLCWRFTSGDMEPSEGDQKEVGSVDLLTGKAESIEKYSNDVHDAIDHLLAVTPTLDPVVILQQNAEHDVLQFQVNDPDTGECITDPREIKRDPSEIIEAINEAATDHVQ